MQRYSGFMIFSTRSHWRRRSTFSTVVWISILRWQAPYLKSSTWSRTHGGMCWSCGSPMRISLRKSNVEFWDNTERASAILDVKSTINSIEQDAEKASFLLTKIRYIFYVLRYKLLVLANIAHVTNVTWPHIIIAFISELTRVWHGIDIWVIWSSSNMPINCIISEQVLHQGGRR